MTETTHLEKVKQTAAQLENVFQVIQSSTHLGSSFEAVGHALKFISAMYSGVEAEIKTLEADQASAEAATPVEAEVVANA